jgi:ABC-type sugar transport system ATPase subunit
VTQLLGNDALVMVSVGGQLVSVRMDIDAALPVNEQVWMAFDPKRMFFYNAEGNLIR